VARISCFRDRVLDEARPYVGGRVPASDGLRLGSVLELGPGLAQKPHAPTRRDPSSFFFDPWRRSCLCVQARTSF
jgi:hypothetical protein